jgi:hypothetical protein
MECDDLGRSVQDHATTQDYINDVKLQFVFAAKRRSRRRAASRYRMSVTN